MVQIQHRKHVLDDAELFPVLIRQHELDHTDHIDNTHHTRSGTYLLCLADLDHEL